MTDIHTTFMEHVDTFRKSFDRFNNNHTNRTITDYNWYYNIYEFIGLNPSLQSVIDDLNSSHLTICYFEDELAFIKRYPHTRPGNSVIPTYVQTVDTVKIPAIELPYKEFLDCVNKYNTGALEIFSFDFDYMIITYAFSGGDLDTRTMTIAPYDKNSEV